MNGADLRKLRESAGITQVELAAFLGYTQQNISAIELRSNVGELLSRRVRRAIGEMSRRKPAA
jgi:transcriptional regulator with XRE-family HTH domain